MPAPVIVVGSVNMDLIFTEVERIPAPGETVSGGSFQISPGGKGANQVAAAARLDSHALFVARVGEDDFGTRALDDLREAGVDLALVKRVGAATGVAAVVIDRSHENAIVIAPGANAELQPDSTADAPDVPDAVVLACLEVPIETVIAWARVARDRGWRFILNPAPARPLPDELLQLVSVLTPNQHELQVMGATPAQLLDAGVEAVVVTLGGDGAELHTAGSAPTRQTAFAVDVLDTTGAGDAFNGAFASSLAEGRSLQAALSRAAAAGALATRRVGARASQPTTAEVDELVASQG